MGTGNLSGRVRTVIRGGLGNVRESCGGIWLDVGLIRGFMRSTEHVSKSPELPYVGYKVLYKRTLSTVTSSLLVSTIHFGPKPMAVAPGRSGNHRAKGFEQPSTVQ